MPVIVPCSTCATHVSVKDEHVGRKLRCPKCKADIDPSGVGEEHHTPVPPPPPLPPALAPVLARPAPPPARLLPPPAPPPPQPSRQPAVESFDFEYEVPRQLPSRKRPKRRASDSGLPDSDAQVMIYVGGLVAVLVVIGVSIAVYTLLIKPLMNSGTAAAGVVAKNNSNVTQANAQRIQAGMTLGEVEAVLGKGRPAIEQDFVDVQNEMKDRAFTESMAPWEPKLRANEVLAWTNGKSRLMVGFSRPPGDGGTVVGVVAVIVDGLSAWSIKFLDTRPGGGGVLALGGGAPLGGPGLPLPPSDEPPPVPVAFADLVADFANDPAAARTKYQKKKLKLTGLVKDVDRNGQVVLVNPAVDEGTSRVRVTFGGNERPDPREAAPGLVITVIAYVWYSQTEKGIHTVYLNAGSLAR